MQPWWATIWISYFKSKMESRTSFFFGSVFARVNQHFTQWLLLICRFAKYALLMDPCTIMTKLSQITACVCVRCIGSMIILMKWRFFFCFVMIMIRYLVLVLDDGRRFCFFPFINNFLQFSTILVEPKPNSILNQRDGYHKSKFKKMHSPKRSTNNAPISWMQKHLLFLSHKVWDIIPLSLLFLLFLRLSLLVSFEHNETVFGINNKTNISKTKTKSTFKHVHLIVMRNNVW